MLRETIYMDKFTDKTLSFRKAEQKACARGSDEQSTVHLGEVQDAYRFTAVQELPRAAEGRGQAPEGR